MYFSLIEIRQEAVKAALAMYSNDKKSIILSSKRNTSNAPPSLTKNETRFPINNIASGNTNSFKNVKQIILVCSFELKKKEGVSLLLVISNYVN